MIKKRNIAIILSFVIPLLFTIGVSTWIIINEFIIRPTYVNNGNLSEYFKAIQIVDYNGIEQVPSHTEIPNVSEEDFSYKYKFASDTNEDNYKDGKPINAGIYDVIVSVIDLGECRVNFTINKVDPIPVKPLLTTIYEGEMAKINGGTIAEGVNNEEVVGSCNYTYSEGTTSLSYVGNDSSSTNIVSITFTPSQSYSNNYNSVQFTVSVTMEAVCYIDNRYYGSIETALDKAVSGEIIYVIPNLESDVYIYNNCTIKSNVTLCLPYKEKTYYNKSDFNNERFYAFDKPETYRVTNVVIKESITVENYGTINIGGVISGGNGGNGPNSHTAGLYAQISLKENSKITSFGKIDCFGFIAETENNNNSSIELNSGELRIPFSIIEHRGGSIFSGMYKNLKSSPFNRCFMQNVTSKLVIKFGSKLYGFADLFASKQHHETNVNLIGNENDYLFNILNNTCFEVKYDIASKVTKIDIFGSFSLNSLVLSVAGANLDTADILFPISWYHNVELHPFKNGTEAIINSLQQNIKILPGGKLKINENVNVSIQSICIYDEITWTDVNVGCSNLYEKNKGDGELIVNGTLNITSLGGLVKTTNNGARLNLSNNNKITAYELKSSSGSSFLTTVDYNQFDFLFKIYLFENNSVSENPIEPEAGVYVSKDNAWVNFSDATTYTLSYETNGGNKIADKNIVLIDESYYLNEFDLPIPVKDYYTFLGWYTDNDKFLIDALGIEIKGDLTIYAKWEVTTYSIDYEIRYDNCNSQQDIINSSTKTFTYIDTIYLNKPIDGTLSFIGWYMIYDNQEYFYKIGNNISIPFTEFYENVIKFKDSNNIVLYGYFIDKEIYTISFDNNNDSIENPETIVVIEGNRMDSLQTYSQYTNNTSSDKYFVGWYTDSNFTEENKINENMVIDSTIPNIDLNAKTLKLYGKWENKYSITYVNGDDIESVYYYMPNSTIYLLSSSSKTDTIVDKQYKITYIPKNWLIDEKEYDLDSSFTLESDTIANAQFDEIRYHAMNFTLNASSIKIEFNGSNQTINSSSTIYMLPDTQINFVVSFNNMEENGNTFDINDKNEYTGQEKTFTYSSYVMPSSIVNIAAKSSSNCLVEGTLITMADGSKRKVEDIKPGDELLVFNHYTGQYDSSIVMFNEEEILSEYTIINLIFDDGKHIGIVSEHGFFDVNLNQYVYIDAENYVNYINHNFIKYELINDQYITTTSKLIDAYLTTETVKVYSPVTIIYLNYFVEEFLSMPGGISGLFNIFEYDENLKYNEELMLQDIEKYGLFAYDDFKDILPYNAYVAFNGTYLKVAIGKELITWENILYLIERYNIYF